MRGYFGIGVENLKSKVNLGTLWRSAYCLNASFIFVIGKRFERQASDTVKACRHIPLYEYKDKDEFLKHIPYDCRLIGVEIVNGSTTLSRFCHPERAIYILGPEDGSLSFLNRCHYVISIPSKFCLNVSVAGSIVMYDRISKNGFR